MGKIVKFLREVVAEMKKVSWSTQRELATYTGVVGIAIVVVWSFCITRLGEGYGG